MRRLVDTLGRRLPCGWKDLARQLALFILAYQGYQLVRGIVHGERAVAIANAERVIHLERSLGAFFEPGFQQAFLGHQWLIDFANFTYLNSHFLVTTTFLVWLYLYRNEYFRFVRNMFIVAMGLALVGYLLFPTAPPRLVPWAGFTDTVSAFTNTNQDSGAVNLLVNPFAAVPSMHIAFALLIGVPGALLARSALARAWWSFYPLLVFFVIVVTANHFWFDAAAGAAVACLAAISATQLARVRPDSWGWRTLPEEAAA